MTRITREVDFDDEDAVLAEVAKALGADPEEIFLDEDKGLSSFGAGTVYRAEWGREEYVVVRDHDQMEELALEVVKQDLDQEPEIFNQDFIERHVNTDRLRRDLESDVVSMRIDDLTDMADRRPDDFWREYESEGFDAPEEDEEGERPEPTHNEIEELAQKQAEEQLRDPMEYLEDIYGREDATKEAIRIAGIDVDAAAQDAVDTDGPEHFLARYDGNSHETKGGLVYWRDN